jgi:hypothetical protein
LEEAVRTWLSKATLSTPTCPAARLYVGRAFCVVRDVVKEVKGSLHVASAGFGLVSADQDLPNYALTIAVGAGSIRKHLESLQASPSQWWQSLNRELGQAGLGDLVRRADVSRVLLSLPSAYLAMVTEELAELRPEEVAKLRVFTSPAGITTLPSHLQRSVLPYDERLELIPKFAGTRADFPQRAMQHFVKILAGHRKTLDEGIAAVNTALAGLTAPKLPHRVRADDVQIAALLRAQWKSHKGSSSRLLRYLRDDALVACEQRRFRGIWQAVKDEFAA